jgi:hypothetical protein
MLSISPQGSASYHGAGVLGSSDLRFPGFAMSVTHRAFLSQELLDRWLADGVVSLEGELLGLLPDGPTFRLESAVLFRAEVAGGEDPLALCGKVKSLPAISDLGGEHAPGSVVLGDSAYEVTEGFVGELQPARDGQAALAALTALVQSSIPEPGPHR